MVTYTIHRYQVDQFGRLYGNPIKSHVWTKELMESYRGMFYVEKIEEVENGKAIVIWESRR